MNQRLFAALVTSAFILSAGCYTRDRVERPDVSSFEVTVRGIYQPRPAPADGGFVQFKDPGQLLPVVSDCALQHGGQDLVPAEKRGKLGCPYQIPRGEVDIDVEVLAIGKDGERLKDFNGPVSFRVVPGDFTSGYPYRYLDVSNGVGSGVVKAAHLYSEVRVWVEDGPIRPIYDGDGGIVETNKPKEPEERTYATGVSEIVWFEDPTLAKLQIPDGFNATAPDFDNRSSPFVGQFITVGKNPESGDTLKQSCADDPERDGKVAELVVTGTDPTGFFVTDVTACRQKELVPDTFTVREPDGWMPGTFGSMFIYNYSFPEGLDRGDTLWTIAGAVQEFTSTTQLTFPSWSVRERVRTRPESQWNIHLDKVPIPEINLRTCGLSDAEEPYITDVLCGHNRRNLKMESLESGLVRLRNLRFPQTFTSCDLDGNGEVPFFCESRTDAGWRWVDCSTFDGPSTATPEEQQEIVCNVQCTTGQDTTTPTVCAERATFNTFGQFIAELAGPGPAAAGLDETLPKRMQKVSLGASSTRAPRSFGEGMEVRVFCDGPAFVKFGDDQVVATEADQRLEANTLLEHAFTAGESRIAVIADGAPQAGRQCWFAQNPKTRINIVTKDAVPELVPDCNPDDADATRAEQCRFFRGARYDVVGHLRHLQPGRPRWVVLPRDKDDMCCRPGPGLQCPNPIKQCPQ